MPGWAIPFFPKKTIRIQGELLEDGRVLAQEITLADEKEIEVIEGNQIQLAGKIREVIGYAEMELDGYSVTYSLNAKENSFYVEGDETQYFYRSDSLGTLEFKYNEKTYVFSTLTDDEFLEAYVGRYIYLMTNGEDGEPKQVSVYQLENGKIEEIMANIDTSDEYWLEDNPRVVRSTEMPPDEIAYEAYTINQFQVVVDDTVNVNISRWEAIPAALNSAYKTYLALFEGAFGQPGRMVNSFRIVSMVKDGICVPEAVLEEETEIVLSELSDPISSFEDGACLTLDGAQEEQRTAFNPFFESLVASTPYIFAGLAVALGFRVGLFNIGVEGQIFVGALGGVAAALYFKDLSPWIHVPLAFGCGALAGGIWGFIPGWLKAKTGGHEVINTIMMNYISFRLSEYLLRHVLLDPEGQGTPITAEIQDSAKLFRFFEDPIRFHIGFLIALGLAALLYWFLFKTTWGFDMRTVGENPNAAKYSGMNVVRSTILAMSLSGAMAGLAGANEVLGVNHNLAVAFSSGYGFDSLALALLGKSHPVGVVLSALLFGFLRNGAVEMQVSAGIPIDIITILQALILAFIAAPAIIRTIYRLKTPDVEDAVVHVRGWGG